MKALGMKRVSHYYTSTSYSIKLNKTARNVHDELRMWLSGRMCSWHVQDPKINPSTTHEKEKKNDT